MAQERARILLWAFTVCPLQLCYHVGLESSFADSNLLHCTLPYVTLPYITLPYITLPCPTLPCPTLPCPTLPCPALHYPALHYAALPFTSLFFPPIAALESSIRVTTYASRSTFMTTVVHDHLSLSLSLSLSPSLSPSLPPSSRHCRVLPTDRVFLPRSSGAELQIPPRSRVRAGVHTGYQVRAEQPTRSA